jgi:hypothetical protein
MGHDLLSLSSESSFLVFKKWVTPATFFSIHKKPLNTSLALETLIWFFGLDLENHFLLKKSKYINCSKIYKGKSRCKSTGRCYPPMPVLPPNAGVTPFYGTGSNLVPVTPTVTVCSTQIFSKISFLQFNSKFVSV